MEWKIPFYRKKSGILRINKWLLNSLVLYIQIVTKRGLLINLLLQRITLWPNKRSMPAYIIISFWESRSSSYAIDRTTKLTEKEKLFSSLMQVLSGTKWIIKTFNSRLDISYGERDTERNSFGRYGHFSSYPNQWFDYSSDETQLGVLYILNIAATREHFLLQFPLVLSVRFTVWIDIWHKLSLAFCFLFFVFT